MFNRSSNYLYLFNVHDEVETSLFQWKEFKPLVYWKILDLFHLISGMGSFSLKKTKYNVTLSGLIASVRGIPIQIPYSWFVSHFRKGFHMNLDRFYCKLQINNTNCYGTHNRIIIKEFVCCSLVVFYRAHMQLCRRWRISFRSHSTHTYLKTIPNKHIILLDVSARIDLINKVFRHN